MAGMFTALAAGRQELPHVQAAAALEALGEAEMLLQQTVGGMELPDDHPLHNALGALTQAADHTFAAQSRLAAGDTRLREYTARIGGPDAPTPDAPDYYFPKRRPAYVITHAADEALEALGPVPEDAPLTERKASERRALLETYDDDILCELFRRGNTDAFTTLIDRHTGFLFRKAWHFLHPDRNNRRGLDVEDVAYAGIDGMLYAARRFAGGITFLGYADLAIKGAMYDAVNKEQYSISVSQFVLQQAVRLYRADGVRQNGGEPRLTDEEAADLLGISRTGDAEKWQKAVATVRLAIQMTFGMESYERLVPVQLTEEDDVVLISWSWRSMTDTNDPAISEGVLRHDLYQALRTLSEQDRILVIKRFGLDGSEPQTHREIAPVLGITYQGVAVREARIMKHLRQEYPSLAAYLRDSN